MSSAAYLHLLERDKWISRIWRALSCVNNNTHTHTTTLINIINSNNQRKGLRNRCSSRKDNLDLD
jgi:hypothetical protein